MDHVLGQFNQICDVRSQINMELFKFLTRKQGCVILIKHMLLIGNDYTVVIMLGQVGHYTNLQHKLN